MKKVFSFLLALLSLTIFHGAKAQTGGDNKSLLWRITGKQMKKPSYLFGTIHIICPDDYLWTDKMKQSLDKSEQVCFEMDLDDPSLLMQVMADMTDHSGKKLKDYFTPDQYTQLEKYVKDSLHTDLSSFQQFKPAFLQTLFAAKSAYCSNPMSYEETIMTTAKKDHKEIVGLEEPKEQTAVLESVPVDSVVKDILDIIQGKNDDRDEFAELVATYKKQDLPELYAMLTKSKKLGDDLGVFLDDRNKKWIDRMEDKMEQKSVFFAVGAGHLWGNNGVISLLRKNGYIVEPVK